MDEIESVDQEQPAKGAAKQLGLSKTIYGLGVATRDSVVAFLAATAALFPVVYFGQGKVKAIDKLAELPDKAHQWTTKNFGVEKSGKIGKTLAVSAGLGFLLSHLANFPGLVYGRKAVAHAEDVFNQAVEDNDSQAREIRRLSETVARQSGEITEMKAKDTVVSQSLMSRVAPTQEEGEGADFASRFASGAGQSNGQKILSQKAAQTENGMTASV